jgi:sugar phosphate isomerase/epimerase
MITRRTFIKTTTLASVSTIVAPGFLKAASLRKDIGLQLYTVRDQIAIDLPGTLKKIADIGYTWLEAAGYSEGKFYGLSPVDFKRMVHDYGMEVISSHATFDKQKQQQAIDAHAELGVQYLVYPSFPISSRETSDDFRQAAQRLNEIGAACLASGLKFGYHNHSFEFVPLEETTGYDLLLNLTGPDLVCFQADFYWMIYAGFDPLDYFRRYPGRFELWHVKDMDDSPEKGFAEVGTGVIDYEKIFRQKDKAGMACFFVEQDRSSIDPMDSIAISFENLKKIIQ